MTGVQTCALPISLIRDLSSRSFVPSRSRDLNGNGQGSNISDGAAVGSLDGSNVGFAKIDEVGPSVESYEGSDVSSKVGR